jgi:hypothetical protein
MHLVRLETADEYNHVINLLKSSWTDYFSSPFILIGGTNVGSPQQWYWAQTGQSIDYAVDWQPGMPDNHQSAEYCLTLASTKGGHQFMLNDLCCEGGQNQFICERVELKLSFCKKECNPEYVINA